ncbi:hypothetical protein KKF23_03930 [Patescibacteria group bacterium]|nr:hypothetical protein [Patescibacteria group bacterium]
MNNDKNIEKETNKAIVETVAFFDLFDYPLIESELWRYCGVECGLEDLKSALSNGGVLGGMIESLDGFYFLAGRREIIKTRQERRGYAQRKIKKAARVSKLFKLIPWIKMIAVGNIIGTDNLKDESDIDLFIITEPERIWLARFFCASFAQLLGLRPKKNNTRDKICLSFFVSEEAMNLEKLMLDGANIPPTPLAKGGIGALKDVYFIYWLTGLKPVYNKTGTYEKFMEANGWIKKYLPNLNLFVPLTPGFPVPGRAPLAASPWLRPASAGKRFRGQARSGAGKLGMTVINRLEQKAKKLQLELLPDNLKKIMNKDTRVVINDKILKLHSNDRREEYRRKWISKIQGII